MGFWFVCELGYLPLNFLDHSFRVRVLVREGEVEA